MTYLAMFFDLTFTTATPLNESAFSAFKLGSNFYSKCEKGVVKMSLLALESLFKGTYHLHVAEEFLILLISYCSACTLERTNQH